MIEVAAAIILQNEKILLARRSPFKDQAGLWEFPGGKIEPDESAESCLIREIKEELNIKITIIKHLINSKFRYPDKSILLQAYICQYVSGNIHLVDHDRVEWVDLKDLLKFEFAPADLPIARKLINHGINF